MSSEMGRRLPVLTIMHHNAIVPRLFGLCGLWTRPQPSRVTEAVIGLVIAT
jgi:hypothetical protein